MCTSRSTLERSVELRYRRVRGIGNADCAAKSKRPAASVIARGIGAAPSLLARCGQHTNEANHHTRERGIRPSARHRRSCGRCRSAARARPDHLRAGCFPHARRPWSIALVELASEAPRGVVTRAVSTFVLTAPGWVQLGRGQSPSRQYICTDGPRSEVDLVASW